MLTAAVKPDAVFAPAAPDIGFIHRATSDAEIYFFANTGNEARRVKATFRVDGLNPEWWDPMSGEVRPATVANVTNGVSVLLDLEPYGSRVLVFSRRERSTLASGTGALFGQLDLSAGWQVFFGESGAPSRLENRPAFVTGDDKTRTTRGSPPTKDFVLPDDFFQKGLAFDWISAKANPVRLQQIACNGMRALLDGPVREAAVVMVNDRRAGSVGCPPYSIDVTESLKVGENKASNSGGHTAINYMAGHARCPTTVC